MASPAWQTKLREIIPSYGTRLNDHPDMVEKEWAYTNEVLQLAVPSSAPTPVATP
ncbi:Malate:quinone oxidoreductase [compost metagenome]